MISYRSPFRTVVVPTSLEKRPAVLAAIRAFAAQDGSDRLRRQTEVAALRRDCELLRRLLLGLLQEAMAEARRDCDPRLRSYVIKYSPDQPRVLAGNPDGGQWTNESGVASSDSPRGSAPSNDALRPVQYAALETGTHAGAGSRANFADYEDNHGAPADRYAVSGADDSGTNDNVTPQQTCQRAYSIGLARIRRESLTFRR